MLCLQITCNILGFAITLASTEAIFLIESQHISLNVAHSYLRR